MRRGKTRKRLKRMLLTLTLTLLLSSCTRNTTANDCAWASEVLPIMVSSGDKLSDQTARDILTANETHEYNCLLERKPTIEAWWNQEISHP